MTDDDERRRLLAWSYRGEVRGEALFAALATTFASDGRSGELEVLRDLEHGMAAALRPLLERDGVDGGDDDRSRTQGTDAAATVAESSWQEFLGLFEATTSDALDRYRRLRALAATADGPLIDVLVAHEEALREFARCHLSGKASSALEPVRSVLEELETLSGTAH